jgi:predicted dienelactone hydrolase
MTYCGFRTGLISDQSRPNWDGTGPRPIHWSAWYPTPAQTTPVPEPFMQLGALQQDAPPPKRPCPVVLISHGTGGTAQTLSWLARALALEGYVVLGPDHHGNTGRAAYRPEGFLCWWERSADMTVMLDHLAACGPLSGALDGARVSALGFSLGGPTVMALMGARFDMGRYLAWRARTPGLPGGPREFPDLAEAGRALLETEGPFRQSWQAHGRDFTDPRVQRAVAIAHAPTAEAFTPESLAAITRPVTLLTGGADTEAPAAQGTDVLLRHNPGFRQMEVDPRAGHYTFLGLPAPGAKTEAPELFTDAPGLDRAAVHRACLAHVLRALAQ